MCLHSHVDVKKLTLEKVMGGMVVAIVTGTWGWNEGTEVDVCQEPSDSLEDYKKHLHVNSIKDG